MGNMSKGILGLAILTTTLVLIVVTLTPSGAFAQTPATPFPKMTIKLGTVAGTQPFYHLGTIRFIELVKERTGGAVEIQYFPKSQLGNEKELMELTRNGVIAMTTGGTPMLAVFPGWEPIGVVAMPYVWKGDDEKSQQTSMIKVMRGPIGREIADKGVKSSGLRALDLVWWAGTQNLVTTAKVVTKVDDIQGLKIRTPDTPIYRLALTALGAKVTPMATTEVYMALKMGVVDGMANTPDLLVSDRIHEVIKHLFFTGHLAQIQAILISDKLYQGFSPALRAIFDQAALEAGDYQNELAVAGNKKALETIKAAGVTVHSVNLAEFQDRTKNAWREFEPQFGQGLYERVVAAQK
jgi:tripartite ATP-independent transporter DctP family solute receptor